MCVRERDIYVISVDLRLGLAHGHAPARQLVRGNAMAIARPLGVPNAGCRLECHGVSAVRRSGATASASRTRPVSSSKAKSHKKDWAKAIRRKSEEIRRKREAAAQADAAAP